MKHYANDPRWMTARYAGNCAATGQSFPAGTRIFYYPPTRSAFIGAAAEAASADFTACAQDEAFSSHCESEEACRNEERFY